MSDPTPLDASAALRELDLHQINRLIGWIAGTNPAAVIDALAGMRKWVAGNEAET